MPLGGGRGVSPPWMLTKIKEQFCCSIRELRSLNTVQKSAGSISSPHLFLSHWLYSFVFPQASCWIALAVLQERLQDGSFLRDREMQMQTGRAVQRLTSRPESETKLGPRERPKESTDRALVLVLEAGVGSASSVRRTISRLICLSTLAHESSQLSTPCVKSIISYVSNHYSLFCHQF